MTQDIWVHIQVDHTGDVARSSLELLSGIRTHAKELGGTVVAVMLGKDVRTLAPVLGRYGAQRVLVADDARFQAYGTDAQTDALYQGLVAAKPQAILLTAGLDGNDIAGRLAVRLGSGLLANATQLTVQDGALVMEETAFDGALMISCTTKNTGTQVITVQPKAFEAIETGGEAVVEDLNYTLEEKALRVHNKETVRSAAVEGIPLEAANIIVAGGRGMGGPEPFSTVLKDLADALGGAVGATRAAVDAGWVPYALQVGQTGKQVKPKVYIACGISGAIQHKVGMQKSNLIIAINKDAEAPIFDFADLGIVGDALTIVPKLTHAMRSRQ